MVHASLKYINFQKNKIIGWIISYIRYIQQLYLDFKKYMQNIGNE